MNGYLCTQLDSTGATCVQWVAYTSFPPALTITDAYTIGTALVGAWALAYTLRALGRFIRNRW